MAELEMKENMSLTWINKDAPSYEEKSSRYLQALLKQEFTINKSKLVF